MKVKLRMRKLQGKALAETTKKRVLKISPQDVKDLPFNKNFPKFVRSLKDDIVGILRDTFANSQKKPSVGSAYEALGPYLKERFPMQEADFEQLQSYTKGVMKLAKKDPNLVPGFQLLQDAENKKKD